MTNSTKPSAETKVSPRAMEAAMIARLVRDLMQQSESSVTSTISTIGWRQDSGEFLLERPRAHPTFSEPQAAVLRLGQFIDRLLYGERFVPDKNPLLRFSTADGQVCDISLESFSQSALGDDGVLVLPYGHSEGAPGSRSALELKNVGRFALYCSPSILLRRQQALLPMREIIEARRRHQELLEQQTRTIEEQERLAQLNIEKQLKEGGTLTEAIASNVTNIVDGRNSNSKSDAPVELIREEKDLVKVIGTDTDSEAAPAPVSLSEEVPVSVVNIKTISSEVVEKEKEIGIEALDAPNDVLNENNLVIPVNAHGLEKNDRQLEEPQGDIDSESILSELESAFSEGLKHIVKEKDGNLDLVPDESIKALILMKEKLSSDSTKEPTSSVKNDIENMVESPSRDSKLAFNSENENISAADANKIEGARLHEQVATVVDNLDEKELSKKVSSSDIGSEVVALNDGVTSAKIVNNKNEKVGLVVNEIESSGVINLLPEVQANVASIEAVPKEELSNEVVDISEGPSLLADSNKKSIEQFKVGLVESSKSTSMTPVISNSTVGWHQIVFNIDLDNLSGFLSIVDDWMEYELRLQIKEQKCSLELVIPKGELALVSPIISKFKVGPIILRPTKKLI